MSRYCPNPNCQDLKYNGVRGEYRDEVVFCPRCGARLADGLPEKEHSSSAPGHDQLVPVSSFQTEAEAAIAQRLLESNGIPTSIDLGIGSTMMPLPGFVHAVRLLVRIDDLEHASSLLAAGADTLKE